MIDVPSFRMAERPEVLEWLDRLEALRNQHREDRDILLFLDMYVEEAESRLAELDADDGDEHGVATAESRQISS
jgi:hypothetical protein